MTAVVLDTDIGGDIDDTWALAMLLRCPELDLRLVTTVTGDTTYRARVAAGILTSAGRDDVAIGIGTPNEVRADFQPQRRFADDIALDRYRGSVRADGIAALVECVMSSHEPVTIIAIGPMTNLAAALALEPEIAHKARVVAMLGSIHEGVMVEKNRDGYIYRRTPGPVPETNVALDVPACRSVLAAPWEITITPLDTCGTVVLRDEQFDAVGRAETPLTTTLLRNYQVWVESRQHDSPERFQAMTAYIDTSCGDRSVAAPEKDDTPFWRRGSTILYDTVAVYLAYDESLVNIERLPIELDDAGTISITAGAPEIRAAVSWRNREMFQAHLCDRLARPIPQTVI